MIMDVCNNAVYSSDSYPKPLCNGFLLMESSLSENMLLGDIWNVIPVPHVW